MEQWKSRWFTEIWVWQTLQYGGGSRLSRYLWVKRVWSIRRRLNATWFFLGLKTNEFETKGFNVSERSLFEEGVFVQEARYCWCIVCLIIWLISCATMFYGLRNVVWDKTLFETCFRKYFQYFLKWYFSKMSEIFRKFLKWFSNIDGIIFKILWNNFSESAQ